MTARPVVVTEERAGTTQTKTYIVTGGNTGLGFECASALASDNSVLVVIACRDVQQGEQAAQRTRDAVGDVKVLPLDLAKQSSIHAFVEASRERHFPPLAGLVCNAGGRSIRALPSLSLFESNIISLAKSGKRLALLASGGEGSATGEYFSDGRQIRSSLESYNTQNELDLWSSSAAMTELPLVI